MKPLRAALMRRACGVVSSYPGTPSTEITEYCAKYPEIYAEWAANEKVALEVCAGASMAGARSICCMKHVGLNVASDPLYTLAYTGVNGGLVVVVADDPGMHSSQNEQDSRMHARGSQVPMLEPSDSDECRAFTKLAFELSEKYDTPVFVRTTTRVAHARSVVHPQERVEAALKPYQKDISKWVMMPGMAKGRHVVVEKRMNDLAKDASSLPVNRVEMGDTKIGVICSGMAYQYVKEVAPEISVLKLGIVNPLPMDLIADFARQVETLYVFEELEPVIEEQVAAHGIPVTGKALTGRQGELSAHKVAKLLGKEIPTAAQPDPVPARPPVLCPGCPHRGVYCGAQQAQVHGYGRYWLLHAGRAPAAFRAGLHAMHGRFHRHEPGIQPHVGRKRRGKDGGGAGRQHVPAFGRDFADQRVLQPRARHRDDFGQFHHRYDGASAQSFHGIRYPRRAHHADFAHAALRGVRCAQGAHPRVRSL